MSKDEILTTLSNFKTRNAQTYGILEMGVFGSVARNQANDDSDVDIFVKTETPNPFMLVHIKEDVEKLLHRRVDIVRFRETMHPLLKDRIEKEGVYV
jgi:predicted nucleotidyltransferase